ncbi:MAG TPA: type II secretion system protein GspN [Kofleriaceae bacterium]|nr:type II secretion system protein GspN [Kofleriaceae bacterium]
MASRVRIPQLSVNLGPRTRKVLRIVAYVFLALFTFVFALQMTFPYDRVKAKIEESLAEKYQVTIADVERGWVPGRVFFNSVTLQTRPAKVDDPVTTVFIERLEVDVDFLPFLAGAASVSIDAKIGPGHLRGDVRISKGGTVVSASGSNLQSQMLPMRDAIGLPMSGTVEFEFDLDLPNEKQKSGKTIPNWQKAEGGARLACPTGCTFGDGKTKLKTKLKNARSAAFAADGIDFGKVTLKSLLAKVEIKTGQLTVTQFEAPSDDGTLQVDYTMELQPVFGESNVTGCLRFNGSPSLLQREPKTFSAITATGAPLGPDNLFHIRLTDKFKDMKRLGQQCSGGVANKGADSSGGGSRPVLPTQPVDPVKPAEVGAPTVTPPPPPPPPSPEGGSAAGSATVPVPGPDSPGSAAPPPAPGSGSAPPPVPEIIH